MLTTGQATTLRFIEDYMADHTGSPSYDEILVGCGYKSKSEVSRVISGLLDRGFIQSRPGKARSIVVIRSGRPGAEQVSQLVGQLGVKRMLELVAAVCASVAEANRGQPAGTIASINGNLIRVAIERMVEAPVATRVYDIQATNTKPVQSATEAPYA